MSPAELNNFRSYVACEASTEWCELGIKLYYQHVLGIE